MTAFSRALVAAAVAISPAEHRPVRREQWQADLRDAADFGLSPTALAFGAFTTALFHRRGVRRTTWGETMTTAPFSTAATPHTIRTVPVLVTVAVLAILMTGPWLILQPNYGYESDLDRTVGVIGFWLLSYLVPGAAVTAAALLLPGSSPGRRRLGAALIAAAAVGAVVTPLVVPDSGWPVSILPAVLPSLLALAGWLVAIEAPRRGWLLLLVPLGVATLIESGALWVVVPIRLQPCIISLLGLAVVVAGLLAWRTARSSRGTRGEEHAATLVDRTA
ncbi:hypothetical protein [Curtobacterium sp. MCBD17_023]|uniref:hypothetical protein n=1 Tax=Curtobacterium sp. MCBD17_023 TaxID=2175657 RepID=UPI000D952AD1|nr:hypothetical protein [Curtobacterium sp. MCBD17_023]PYY48791.1 hypothetical protein DEI84_08900 [Curtobacterium sp. MCBD17_023]